MRWSAIKRMTRDTAARLSGRRIAPVVSPEDCVLQIAERTRQLSAEVEEHRVIARDLMAARERAEHANLAKSRFVSTMSHELRTPLNAIIGFGEFLIYNPKAPLHPSQRTAVDQILRAGSHLLELVNDLLDLSRIEAGKLAVARESLAVADVLAECLELVQLAAAHKDIAVIQDVATGLPAIDADRVRLKQTVLNLLSNAIKYTPTGGTVTVRGRIAEPGRIAVEVADTGIGIPATAQDGVFEPFNRLGREATGVEGTGIGLTVAKQCVEQMGGTLTFDSAPGLGSTFRIVLDQAAVVPQASRAPNAA